jgi:hypothetical protein
MDTVGKVIGLSLLMFVGCLSTVPTSFQFAPPDPFAIAPPDHFTLEPPLETDENVSDPASGSIAPDPIENQAITESSEIPLEEFIFEPEGVSITTEAEQADLLSQNNWVKNIALINLLDSGKKPSLGDLSPKDRQRRDEINRLNMSQEELAKKQNKKFEYVDGSASDWRWMHRGVDKLHAIPIADRESAKVFLQADKYKEKKYLTLRINAAILLGRDGNPAIKKYLLQLVQSETVPIPLRCAAIEVLGRMPMVTADDLIPLIENVKDRTVEKKVRKTGEQIKQLQAGNIDVWEELLHAISEKIDPWEHDCFLEPFHAVTIDRSEEHTSELQSPK